ncbi:MAG: hypothetical protein PHZ02_07330 [Desulfocapsaceae bacterium]|nr:hypothetical protein [Desulfocapsaceae bacterium]
MKKGLLLSLLAMALLLGGCAGGDYDKYADTMATHSTAESTRIASQSAAISSMVAAAKPATPMEGTLLAVIGMMQVERLQPVPLGIGKPTTGMDVLNSVAGQLPMGIIGLSNWGIAKSLSMVAGDTNTFNGDANLTDSMNKSYSTQLTTAGGSIYPTTTTSITASGEGTTATNSNPTPLVTQ